MSNRANEKNKTSEKNKAINLDVAKEGNEGEDTAIKVNKTIGVVSGCQRLNVRGEASADAEVVSAITENSEVIIDEEASTEDFYKVCTTAGVEGYCMRQYISIL
jgi:ABC-type molybdenum transport system ATPase subunit/photorepair protein PhrA